MIRSLHCRCLDDHIGFVEKGHDPMRCWPDVVSIMIEQL